MILFASLLLNLGALTFSTTLTSKLHINEHGAVYDQRVEYDDETRAITLHIPPHHDVLEQTIIIHADSVKPTDTKIFKIFYCNLCLEHQSSSPERKEEMLFNTVSC